MEWPDPLMLAFPNIAIPKAHVGELREYLVVFDGT